MITSQRLNRRTCRCWQTMWSDEGKMLAQSWLKENLRLPISPVCRTTNSADIQGGLYVASIRETYTTDMCVRQYVIHRPISWNRSLWSRNRWEQGDKRAGRGPLVPDKRLWGYFFMFLDLFLFALTERFILTDTTRYIWGNVDFFKFFFSSCLLFLCGSCLLTNFYAKLVKFFT